MTEKSQAEKVIESATKDELLAVLKEQLQFDLSNKRHRFAQTILCHRIRTCLEQMAAANDSQKTVNILTKEYWRLNKQHDELGQNTTEPAI
jgi:hypothetical protein